MSTITPMLDTVLPQVLGRSGDVERVAAAAARAPLAAVLRIPPSQDARGHSDQESEVRAGTHERSAASASARREDGLKAAAGAARAAMPQTSGGQSGSVELHFSAAGHAIARLLQMFAKTPAAASVARAPLVPPSTVPQPPVLALMLGQQVGFSGVFYESHLLQWMQGKRSMRELAEEPQMRLSASAAQSGDDAADAASREAAKTLLAARAAAGSAQAGPPSPHAAAGAASSHHIIDDQLLPLLCQQLDTLNAGVFRWQGQPWPGASMDWEIREEEDDARAASSEPLRRYVTSLRLELPALGALEVRLALDGQDIQVHAWAEDDEGEAMLRADRQTLCQRLRTAGFDHATVELVDNGNAT